MDFPTKLTMQNFMAFGEEAQEFRLAPLSLIYGPNSAGKSTILRALRALHDSQPRDIQSVHRYHQKKSVGWYALGLEMVTPLRPVLGGALRPAYQASAKSDTRVRLEKTVEFPSDTGEGSWVSYDFSSECGPSVRLGEPVTLKESGLGQYLGWIAGLITSLPDDFRDSLTAFRQQLDTDEATSTSCVLYAESDGFPSALAVHPGVLRDLAMVQAKIAEREVPNEGALAKSIGLWLECYRCLAWMTDPANAWLESLNFIEPLRPVPRRGQPTQWIRDFADLNSHRYLRTDGPRVREFLPSPEMSWDEFMKASRTQKDDFIHWLRELDLPYGLDVEGETPALVDSRTDTPVTFLTVGTGISQVIPILVKGLTGKVILVQQPELHLHPNQQGHVADFMVDGVATRGQQWIVESHSEAVVSRVLRRIREKKLRPDQVSLLYVEPGADGARVSELRISDKGEFVDAWPDGFFENTYWDLFGGTQ